MLYQLSYSRSVGKGTCSRSFGDALRVCPSSAPAPQIWNLAKKAFALQAKDFLKKLTLAGLEPAIFGSEDQRLIH